MSDLGNGLISGLEKLAAEYLKRQILAELAKKAPWLFGKYIAWLTNPLIGVILDSLLMFLLKKTVLGLSLAWIGIDIQYEVQDAEKAVEKLKEILENPQKYTQKQIEETEAQFDQEMVDLIHIELART